jgi:CubicO group peptidase (beta-lactamase class C family)
MTRPAAKIGALFAILLALLLLAACAVPEFTAPELTTPEETGDGWAAGTLAEAGLDEAPLREALRKIEAGDYPALHSLLIVKDGRLVLEAYFPGHAWVYDAEHFQGPAVAFDRDTPHTIMSVTKAVTAAAAGTAVEQGAINSVQDPIFDYFPAYDHLRTPQKEAITIEHLLTMSSGLAWNEWEYPLSDVRNDLIQLWLTDDPVAYILSKPLAHNPGSSWYYSGGDVILLGEIIQQATGRLLDQYAAEHLMAPLGITDYEWDFINADTVHASGDLMLRPRDMAKFGYLLLNNGRWGDTQVLTEDWVTRTSAAYIDTPNTGEGQRYGYQWWHMTFPTEDGPIHALHRSGWGGQELYLFPDQDMMVAMTGGSYETTSPGRDIIANHILPALQNDQ